MTADVDGGGTDTGDSDGGAPGDGALSPVWKSSLLWGVVGGLAFLVLGQGYQLLTDETLRITVLFGVAVAVAAVTAGLSYGIHRWSAGRFA